MGSKSKQPAARLGDTDSGHSPYPPTPITSGSGDVFINGKPAARQGDKLAPHHRGQRVITEGSGSVLINGKPAARVTDGINCGGSIVAGSGNVLIGDSPEPPRNARLALEFQEYMRESFKPENFGLKPHQDAQLAADIAVKYRGPEGAIATWHDYYLNHDAEPQDFTDPLKAQGLARAEAEAAKLAREAECLAKGERWRQRQQSIAQARAQASSMAAGPDRDRLLAAADRFAMNNVAVEKARLSEDVYQPESGPPPGWINISDEPEALDRLGLLTNHLSAPNSAFRAQVYAPDPAVFGMDMKTTISFKGTTCREDWENNLAQAFDQESLYYRKAVAIGRAIEMESAGVEFTGQSLGGGMGSAASRASGKPGITFNAAGLHPNTVIRYGGTPKINDPDTLITYQVRGDAVTLWQESKTAGAMLVGAGGLLGGAVAGAPGAAVGSALGARVAALRPRAAGTPHILPGTGINPLARHGMLQVINGIELKKHEDQRVLDEYGAAAP